MMTTAAYGWAWSWDEASDIDLNDPHYPDCHNSSGYHWITVYEYGLAGVVDEVCTLPLYTSCDGWRDLIPGREAKAAMIVGALTRELHDAGG